MTSATTSTLLTPPGAGAIAVIRITGPAALHTANQAFRPKSAPPLASSDRGRLRYGHIVDGDEIIDDVIACRVSEGENESVELSSHGGVRVVERILSLLERLGARFNDAHDRPPQPWLTSNAIEAEALAETPHAKTERALRFLVYQRENLASHLDHIADQCLSAPQQAHAELTRLLHMLTPARRLLDGCTVAIVGPPNSGKSTLFNHLVGRTRAVVSPHAGTTRDWIEEAIEIEGIPIRLIDTAGRHETSDALESEAIQAGSSRTCVADLQLLVFDQSAHPPRDFVPPRTSNTLLVANKSDFPPTWQFSDLGLDAAACLRISAATGAGIPQLLRRIADAGLSEPLSASPSPFTERQRALLELALGELRTSAITCREIIQHKLIAGRE